MSDQARGTDRLLRCLCWPISGRSALPTTRNFGQSGYEVSTPRMTRRSSSGTVCMFVSLLGGEGRHGEVGSSDRAATGLAVKLPMKSRGPASSCLADGPGPGTVLRKGTTAHHGLGHTRPGPPTSILPSDTGTRSLAVTVPERSPGRWQRGPWPRGPMGCSLLAAASRERVSSAA